MNFHNIENLNDFQKIRTDFSDVDDFVKFLDNIPLWIYKPSKSIICIAYTDLSSVLLECTNSINGMRNDQIWLKSKVEGEEKLADREHYVNNPNAYMGFIPAELFELSYYDHPDIKGIETISLKDDFNFIDYLKSLSIFREYIVNDNFISNEAPPEYDLLITMDKNINLDFQSNPEISYGAFCVYNKYGYDYFEKCNDIPELEEDDSGESYDWKDELDFSDIEGDSDLRESYMEETLREMRDSTSDEFFQQYIFSYEEDQIDFFAINSFDIYENYKSVQYDYDWGGLLQHPEPITELIKKSKSLGNYFEFIKGDTKKFFKWHEWKLKEIKKILNKRPNKIKKDDHKDLPF